MAKIFIVGPKASFVNGGRSYKPGDEIPGDLFKDKALAAAVKGGHLIEKDGASMASPAPGGDTGGKKSLDDMTLIELRDYAAEKKIPVSGKKEEVLAAIKEAEAKTSGGESGGGEPGALPDAGGGN